MDGVTVNKNASSALKTKFPELATRGISPDEDSAENHWQTLR